MKFKRNQLVRWATEEECLATKHTANVKGDNEPIYGSGPFKIIGINKILETYRLYCIKSDKFLPYNYYPWALSLYRRSPNKL